MTPEEFKAIKARHAVATKGPWELIEPMLIVGIGGRKDIKNPEGQPYLFRILRVIPADHELNADGTFKLMDKDLIPIHDMETRANQEFVLHSWEDVKMLIEALEEIERDTRGVENDYPVVYRIRSKFFNTVEEDIDR